MTRKKQHIDDFFKDRLKGQDLPLDGSEWIGISKELQGKKKRRGFFWWLLLPIAALSIWLISNSLYHNSTNAQEKSSALINNRSQIEQNQKSAGNSESNNNLAITEETAVEEITNIGINERSDLVNDMDVNSAAENQNTVTAANSTYSSNGANNNLTRTSTTVDTMI